MSETVIGLAFAAAAALSASATVALVLVYRPRRSARGRMRR